MVGKNTFSFLVLEIGDENIISKSTCVTIMGKCCPSPYLLPLMMMMTMISLNILSSG